MIKDTNIGLGAQNLHWEASGAYTGEISAGMVKEFCDYVIIGHSERRQYFGETDETVNKKTKAAQAAQLLPIVCVGETLAENEAGKTKEIVTRQLRGGLARWSSLIPPNWSSPTNLSGLSAPPRGHCPGCPDVCALIAAELVSIFGKEMPMPSAFCTAVRHRANAAELFAMPDIDGGLVAAPA